MVCCIKEEMKNNEVNGTVDSQKSENDLCRLMSIMSPVVHE